ncbi:hypothetical protein GM415_00210 [Pseudodesulfovibrio cashew]|uniref:SsuA/THI5-like domain-containing protein n=1 Tax=Pseudodesulfovibrio cashew TaxID=2678688 RepID=A0A6I6JBX3_9BACT|nr:ABC transporter substrate-binding protein [Pseudodesulfovibrio cashew]QGY38629.1 hypothetical protein GM415_00210 [Pseudodesulfovibrio cashew]
MITRRNFLLTSARALALAPFLRAIPARASNLDHLALAGPPAPLSLPLARLAQHPGSSTRIPHLEMKQWRNPDIMRAWMVSGEVQVAATPANAAAMLYNKGLPVRLMDVNNGGILSILTRDPEINRFTDLKGKKALLFYRGDIPDIIVRFLAAKQGMNPDKDMALSYVGSPFEGLQMLLSGRADTALLPEPAATAAELKAKSKGMALKRIMLQDIWEEVTGKSLFMPVGGTMCQASLAEEHPDVAKSMQDGIGEAVEWINGHPGEAASQFAGMFGLKAPVLQQSLERFPLRRSPAAEAREEMEFYYSALMETAPRLTGGKLPDEAFYLG